MMLSVDLRAPLSKDMTRNLMEEVREVFKEEVTMCYQDIDLLGRISITTTNTSTTITTTTDKDSDTSNNKEETQAQSATK